MTHSTLSTLGRVETLLRTTDLTVARLAALASLFGIPGASEMSLGRALKGAKGLSANTDAALGALVRQIEKLIETVAPIEVRFANTSALKKWLDDLEQGTLAVLVIEDMKED